MGNHKIIWAAGTETVRYSMYDFIEYVCSQPVIWDHHDEGFHNREQREEAWHNVARKLYASFDSIKNAEKLNIVQTLTKRWKNTRDSYLRSFRLGQSYIYEKELHFLRKSNKRLKDTATSSAEEEEQPQVKAAKTAPKRKSVRGKIAKKHKLRTPPKQRRGPINSNFSRDSEIEQVCNDIEEHLQDKTPELSKKVPEKKNDSFLEAPSMHETRQKTAGINSNTNGNTMALLNESKMEEITIQCPPQVWSSVTEAVADGDQSFFDSIKPVIRKMSENKKLDFAKKTLEKKIDSSMEAPSTSGQWQKAINMNSNTNGKTQARNEGNLEESTMQCSTQVSSGGTEAVADADQAFFDSIKPVIRKMGEDKKLDFQIEVLKLLKNFRSN